jgi:hypothetical protein
VYEYMCFSKKRIEPTTLSSTSSVHVICQSNKHNNNQVTVRSMFRSLGTTEVTCTKNPVVCSFASEMEGWLQRTPVAVPLQEEKAQVRS